MKKTAFTIMEVTLCLVVISVIIIFTYSAIWESNQKTYKKIIQTRINKTILEVQEATEYIKAHDTARCPMNKFIERVGNTYEFILQKSDGSGDIDADDLMAAYMEHMKFDSDVIDFCDHVDTANCSECNNFCNNSTIKGGKLPGGISGSTYIGFKVYDNIQQCPNYVTPEGDEITTRQSDRCWGELYIKVENNFNGSSDNFVNSNDPDGQIKNVFIFGMNDKGILY